MTANPGPDPKLPSHNAWYIAEHQLLDILGPWEYWALSMQHRKVCLPLPHTWSKALLDLLAANHYCLWFRSCLSAAASCHPVGRPDLKVLLRLLKGLQGVLLQLQ